MPPQAPPRSDDIYDRLTDNLGILLFLITNDWRSWVQDTWEMVVYIGRYGNGQQIEYVQHWPLSKVRRVAEILSSAIKKENRAAKSGK